MSSKHIYKVDEQIRSLFQPTYLYIKQHKITGLKYLGKTITDPYKYNGSGKIWTLHLDKHGYEIETIWIHLFTDIDILASVALALSEIYDVVESDYWANMVPETGIGGHTSAISTKICKKLIEEGRHNFQSREFINNQIIRKKQEVLNGTHSSQVRAKNGTHHFQSDDFKQNTANRNKEHAMLGIHPWQDANFLLEHGKRSKDRINKKQQRPIYLEVKEMCISMGIKQPRSLHMRTDDFLINFKQELLKIKSQ